MKTFNQDKVREKLLGTPQRQDVVLGAIDRYNGRLAQIKERLGNYEGNEVQQLKKGITDLESKITANSVILGNVPTNIEVRQKLNNQRSNKKILENILLSLENGESVSDALSPLPRPSRVHDYSKAMEFLRKKGVVVNVSKREEVGVKIRDAADYQIVLLDRAFEVPAPLSQTLVKNPKVTKEKVREDYLRYRVEEAIKAEFGVDLEVIYRDVRDVKYAKARKAAAKLRNSDHLNKIADDVASDMMSFEPVYLLQRDKTKEEFVKGRFTPEDAYKQAFEKLSKSKNYLSITFRGFDVHHPKKMLTVNNSVGMRIHMYSRFLEYLQKHGVGVATCDMTGISKAYAHGSEGEVMSRSGTRISYDPWINHVSDFRKPLKEEAYTLWADIDGACHCEDSKYVGRLHSKMSYNFTYFCAHTVALFCAYAERAQDENRTVLSPFIFPLDDQVEFEKKVANQVLIARKEDGAVKAANRAEHEWLNLLNATEIGYGRAYTTRFKSGKAAMYRIYFGSTI